MVAEELFLHVRGLDIFLKRMGSGNPLVFLHGGPGAEHGCFLPHVEPLAEHFQLIFYDQRGCGRSQRADDPCAYTLEEEVETLEELRQRLGIEKLNLIGESWGTMLALLYAVKYTHRVNKLVLSSAVGATADGLLRFSEELEKRMSDSDRQAIAAVSEKLDRGEGELDELFVILDPYYVYSLDTLARNSKTVRNPEVNRIMSEEIIAHYDVRNSLKRIESIEVLVLQGAADLLSPAILEDLLIQYLPQTKFRVIEECGHWIFVEQSDRFNEMIKNFF